MIKPAHEEIKTPIKRGTSDLNKVLREIKMEINTIKQGTKPAA